jgi:hypothetical protein
MLRMYSTVLLLHSLVRWLVVASGLVAAARGIAGSQGRRPWSLADERAGFWFVMTLDLQFLLGLLLYFALSPITTAALHDFSGAMRIPAVRFWAVEHVTGMVIGIALAHVGRTRIHKSGNDTRRHRLAAIFFTLALLVILASIPWPGTQYARPLLRW